MPQIPLDESTNNKFDLMQNILSPQSQNIFSSNMNDQPLQVQPTGFQVEPPSQNIFNQEERSNERNNELPPIIQNTNRVQIQNHVEHEIYNSDQES